MRKFLLHVTQLSLSCSVYWAMMKVYLLRFDKTVRAGCQWKLFYNLQSLYIPRQAVYIRTWDSYPLPLLIFDSRQRDPELTFTSPTTFRCAHFSCCQESSSSPLLTVASFRLLRLCCTCCDVPVKIEFGEIKLCRVRTLELIKVFSFDKTVW